MSKKIIYPVLLAVFLTIAIAAGAHAQSSADPCSHVTLDWVRSHAPFPVDQLVEKSPIKQGFCLAILKVRRQYQPIFATKDYFVIGELFANRTATASPAISKLKESDIARNMENLATVTAITYKPKTYDGKYLYLVTDPLCPYCQTVNNDMVALSEKYGVEIRVVFYNVHRAPGKEKIVEAICKKFSFPQYIAKEWKEKKEIPPVSCPEGEALYDRSQKIAVDSGVESVPMMILGNNVVISGADMKGIASELDRYAKAKK